MPPSLFAFPGGPYFIPDNAFTRNKIWVIKSMDLYFLKIAFRMEKKSICLSTTSKSKVGGTAAYWLNCFEARLRLLCGNATRKFKYTVSIAIFKGEAKTHK